MVNRPVLLSIAAGLLCSVFATAQSPLGSPVSAGGSSQQSGNCADPANAGTSACVSDYDTQQQGNGQMTQAGPDDSRTSTRDTRSGQNSPTYTDNGGAGRNYNNPSSAQAAPVAPSSPEPLTEFQRLVASTEGRLLPIFGYDLFRGVPSTFAPVDQVPVTSDYVIGPGDEIRIRVWGQVNFNANLKVDRSGDIYVPQVGPIHVVGVPFSELSQQVRTQIARVYRNFDLTVDLGQLRSIQIFVVGQARRPGAYTVSSLSTLVNALFASGGPSVQGSMRDIQLKRDGKVVTDFDLYDLLLRGDKSKDSRLLPGDVIFIPAVGPQVALTGSVRKPAIYELNSRNATTTVNQLLDSAGGLSTIAAGSRISIERIEDRQNRQAMEVALDAVGLGTPLQDGDIVRLLSITPRYQNTVTLRGNLANPGRFAWHDGMKLSELIPDRPSLITRNYWWRRTQLGLPGPEFQPLSGRGPLYQPTQPSELPDRRSPRFANPGEDAFANSNTQLDQGISQGANAQDASQPNINNSPASSQLAQRNRALAAQSEASGSTLAGQQSQIMTQNVAAAAGDPLQVKLSAPEIDWSYAVIERLDPATLKTSLLSFNLGKLVIDHDSTQDLALQPGDVVTVFSQADIRVPLSQQTKFVRLEGEFVSAGVYSVGPNETLRQLVQRAGGLTPEAYLFGSDFTRESTRVFQQQRLDEYVQSLEVQIERGSLNLAASAVSPQDTAAANSASVTQQALIARLRQLRATGRIVLEVKPDSTGIDSIPDLPLQDDDHFSVPSVPASVNMVGSVYDQNSFLYQPGRRVGDYMRLAGGPNRDADKRHIFILRADGSVQSRESANGLWGNEFAAMKLNPGDSIVVPEKILGSSTLRSLLNWSQLFSQLALGVAAITVLHNY